MEVNNLTALHRIGFTGAEEPTGIDSAGNVEIPETKDTVAITKSELQPPEISSIRLMFSRLTNEQIKQVNASRKLPVNGKFMRNEYGGYVIGNNWFNINTGTRILPGDFELKKGVLGFTKVVPKGSEGLFIKDAT